MSSLASASVQSWQYHDIAARARDAAERAAAETFVPLAAPGISEDQVAQRVQAALAQAQSEWTAQAEAEQAKRDAQMAAALEAFSQERTRYFGRVEAEVVHLALGIARKILDREAQLDPTLLSGLVRIALDRMGAGTAVRLRLPPERLAAWQAGTDWANSRYTCEFVADDTLLTGDCLVETDLGSANFGFDTQLKEIEQGLLGILEQRPALSSKVL